MKATLKNVLRNNECNLAEKKGIDRFTHIKDLTVKNLFDLMFILPEDYNLDRTLTITGAVLDELTKRAYHSKKQIF